MKGGGSSGGECVEGRGRGGVVGREWCRGEGVVKGEGVVERGGSSGGESVDRGEEGGGVVGREWCRGEGVVVTLVPRRCSCVLGPRRHSGVLGPCRRSGVLALVAVRVCWALVIVCVCWCWALVRSSSVVLVRRLWSSGWSSLGLGGCGFLRIAVVHCPRGHRLLMCHRVLSLLCRGWCWAPVAVCGGVLVGRCGR